MLKKPNRIRTRYEFWKVRKDGVHISARHFHLYYLQRRDFLEETKVGIIVSNKFSKSAVKRNRTKRVFREIVRTNFDKMKPGYWITIHPRFHTAQVTYEEINTDFIKILQKVPFSKEFRS